MRDVYVSMTRGSGALAVAQIGLLSLVAVGGSGLCFGGAVAAQFDPTTYTDSVTSAVVTLARARHQGRVLAVGGYKANVFSRVEGRIGASRFARGMTVFAYETAARMHWARPGDVKIDVIGARSRAPRIPGLNRDQVSSFWEDIFTTEPWFVPGAIGDRIQMMGIPDEEAVHPLAAGAEDLYHYSISDSVLLVLPGRSVRAIGIRVEPKGEPDVTLEEMQPRRVDSLPAGFEERLDAAMRTLDAADPDFRTQLRAMIDSLQTVRPGDRVVYRVRRARTIERHPTLVSGELWIDADSLDVVRMIVAFVGDHLWDDNDAPELVQLEVDLEYGLHDGRYWLPHRQTLSANFIYKYLPGVDLPATAVTTFSDFTIDLGETEFSQRRELPDGVSERRFGSWRCPDAWEFDARSRGECGREPYEKVYTTPDGAIWEITVPTRDSLERFEFGREFSLSEELADDDFVQRVGRLAQLSEQVDQAGRADELQVDWQRVYDAVQFNRVQGLSLGAGYQWHPGIDFTTIHARVRFGFGDGRATGGVTWRRDAPAGRLEFDVSRSLRSVEPWAIGWGLGGGLRTLFLGHDDRNYFLALGARATYGGYAGVLRDGHVVLWFERQRSIENATGSAIHDFFFGSGVFLPNPPVRDGNFLGVTVGKTLWLGSSELGFGGDVMTGARDTGARLWGTVAVPWSAARARGTIRLRAGAVAGDSLPQLEYRVGGRNTVRGYDYGTRRGRSFWSLRVDTEWVASQWWSPVVFTDIGNVSRFADPLVGLGLGVSALSGWVRADLSKGVNPGTAVRFDVLFQIPFY